MSLAAVFQVLRGFVAALGLWVVTKAGGKPYELFDTGVDLYPWLLAALAGLAFVEACLAAWRDVTFGRAARFERDVSDALNSLYRVMIEHRGGPDSDGWNKVTVSAYVRRFDWRCRHFTMKRVGRTRFYDAASTGIDWVKGKGVIGQAWELPHKTVLWNREDEWGVRPGAPLTEKAWNGVEHSKRLGFTFDEASRLDGYGTVIAAACQRGTRVVGVVVVDAPHDWLNTLKDDAARSRLVEVTRWISAAG